MTFRSPSSRVVSRAEAVPVGQRLRARPGRRVEVAADAVVRSQQGRGEGARVGPYRVPARRIGNSSRAGRQPADLPVGRRGGGPQPGEARRRAAGVPAVLAGRAAAARQGEHRDERGRRRQTARCCRRHRSGHRCCRHPDRRRCAAGSRGDAGGGGACLRDGGWPIATPRDRRWRPPARRRRSATSVRRRLPASRRRVRKHRSVPFLEKSGVLFRTTTPDDPSRACRASQSVQETRRRSSRRSRPPTGPARRTRPDHAGEHVAQRPLCSTPNSAIVE